METFKCTKNSKNFDRYTSLRFQSGPSEKANYLLKICDFNKYEGGEHRSWNPELVLIKLKIAHEEKDFAAKPFHNIPFVS